MIRTETGRCCCLHASVLGTDLRLSLQPCLKHRPRAHCRTVHAVLSSSAVPPAMLAVKFTRDNGSEVSPLVFVRTTWRFTPTRLRISHSRDNRTRYLKRGREGFGDSSIQNRSPPQLSNHEASDFPSRTTGRHMVVFQTSQTKHKAEEKHFRLAHASLTRSPCCPKRATMLHAATAGRRLLTHCRWVPIRRLQYRIRSRSGR